MKIRLIELQKSHQWIDLTIGYINLKKGIMNWLCLKKLSIICSRKTAENHEREETYLRTSKHWFE